MKNICFVLFIVLLLSCQKRRNNETLPTTIEQVVHIENAIKNHTSDFSSLIDSSWIVPLKTPAENIQGILTKVETDPNYIYTLDEFQSKSLNLYDKQGNFIRSIGKIGRGPQELANICDFCLFGNKIFLVDNIMQKLQIFDIPGGKHIKTVTLPFRPHELYVANDQCYFFQLSDYNDDSAEEYRTHSIVVTDSNFQPQKFLLPRAPVDPSKTQYISINNPLNFCKEIFYFSPMTDFIYRYNGDTVAPVIAIDFGEQYEIPYSKRDDDEVFTKYAKANEYAYFIESPIILEDYIAGTLRVNDTKKFLLCHNGQEYSQTIDINHYHALDPIFPIGREKDNILISTIDMVGIGQLKKEKRFSEVIGANEDANFLLFTKLK